MGAFAAGAGDVADAPVFPVETGLFRAGPGAEIANAQCLVCHSVEYVTTQPPLPRAYWKGSIDKMRGKFGATIPDDQIGPLLDYLVLNYGKADAPGAAPVAAIPAGVPATGSDARSLMTRRGCFNCHQPRVKFIGPAYSQVAAKYASDPDGATRIMEQIKNGGSGKWGPIPMPPAPGLSDAEMASIARWILDLK
jgi:sulfite dehydrogenase